MLPRLRSPVKAVSLDVTGTLLAHRHPIYVTYADAAKWARLKNPPSADELKPAFKKAYFESLTKSPCFGHAEGLSSRQWWVRTVQLALSNCGRSYTDAEFDRFFRRVYQHYGSLEGYVQLPDAAPFLTWAGKRGLMLGITTNTPSRTMDTVVPMLGLHEHFRWFVCSQEVGEEKPHQRIYAEAHAQAAFWMPGIKPEEILHIGDSLESDFCGARAAGFQAIHLDRSDSSVRVTKYQDWLEAPSYPGKSEDDIRQWTVTSLEDARKILEATPGALPGSSSP